MRFQSVACSFFPLFLFSSVLLFPFVACATVHLTVSVSGLNKVLEQNVLHYLQINNYKDHKELSPSWIRHLHSGAEKEIQEALYPYGYYHAKIQKELTHEEDNWNASYTVSAGEPNIVNKYTIKWLGEGAGNPRLQSAIAEYLQNTDGQVIHSKFEAAKTHFLQIASSNGYPQAKIIKSEIVVEQKSYDAEMTLLMETGPLYFLGEVSFNQNFLDPALLQKYVRLQASQPYSHDALLTLQQDLIASSYAREVTIKPQFDQAYDQLLPVEVVLKPIIPYKISFGLGYETDIGIRGSGLLEDRLINHHGHHSELFTKLSSKEGEMRGQYYIPIHNVLTDSWVSSASGEYEKTSDTSSNTVTFETALLRQHPQNIYFFKTFLLGSYDSFTLGDTPRVNSKLFSIGGTIRLSEMEESIFPLFAYSIYADLRGATELLLSDTNYLRVHIKGRYLHKLGENSRLDTHFEFGSTWVQDYDIYPTSLRFFAGGDSSVRGYRYASLGPINADGENAGGKHIVTASIEYNYRVQESWVVDLFTDAGNAYDNSLEKVYIGSGIGCRWHAPFGSLRLDLAWPVSENPEFDDLRVHIGFGATL